EERDQRCRVLHGNVGAACDLLEHGLVGFGPCSSAHRRSFRNHAAARGGARAARSVSLLLGLGALRCAQSYHCCCEQRDPKLEDLAHLLFLTVYCFLTGLKTCPIV